jgi:hypothetical protein
MEAAYASDPSEDTGRQPGDSDVSEFADKLISGQRTGSLHDHLRELSLRHLARGTHEVSRSHPWVVVTASVDWVAELSLPYLRPCAVSLALRSTIQGRTVRSRMSLVNTSNSRPS